MKHFVRNTAALGAVLVIVGFGMAKGARMIGAEWNSSWFRRKSVFTGWPEDWEKLPEDADLGEIRGENTSGFSDVEKISVYLEEGEIIWKPGEGEDILVTCGDGDDPGNRYQVYREEDRLVIRAWGKENDGLKIEIAVPTETVFSDVDMEINKGVLRAEGVNCSRLEVELAAGKAELAESRTEEGEFSCAAGEILYQGVLTGDSEASCAAGSIRLALNQKKSDMNYELNAAGGSIQLGESRYSAVAMQDFVDSEGDALLKLDVAAGSIQVEFDEEDGL